LASQLAAEVTQLEQLRAENTKLRTQIEAPPAGFLTPEETDALAKAKEKAESIACINNLKQWGTAFILYTSDNDEWFPNYTWQSELTPYLDIAATAPQIARCPSAPRTNDVGQPMQFTYEYSGVSTGTLTYIGFNNGTVRDFSIKWSQIRFASDKALLTEMYSKTYNAWRSSAAYNNECFRRMHGDGSNVMFADGHVEWLNLGPGDRYEIIQWGAHPRDYIFYPTSAVSWR